MKRQRPRTGDIFVIEVSEEYSSFGQVLEVIPEALNSVGIALWSPELKNEHLRPRADEEPLAVLLVTPDLLKRGAWQIRTNEDPLVPVEGRPYEVFRSSAWVGARIIGSGIVREFLEASIGLKPWDDWANPRYLDELLYPGKSRPTKVVFKHAS